MSHDSTLSDGDRSMLLRRLKIVGVVAYVWSGSLLLWAWANVTNQTGWSAALLGIMVGLAVLTLAGCCWIATTYHRRPGSGYFLGAGYGDGA
jgi:hypothetical protein